MVRDRLVDRVIGSLSVAVLFALLGSVTVAGGVTVAVLTAFWAKASGPWAMAMPASRAVANARRTVASDKTDLL